MARNVPPREKRSEGSNGGTVEVANTCDAGKTISVTIPVMRASSIDEDQARSGLLTRVSDKVAAECSENDFKCDGACGEDEACVVDIDPNLESKITCKPGLRFNSSLRKFDRIYTCTFAATAVKLSCTCAALV